MKESECHAIAAPVPGVGVAAMDHLENRVQCVCVCVCVRVRTENQKGEGGRNVAS